jgi:hypothetical protein
MCNFNKISDQSVEKQKSYAIAIDLNDRLEKFYRYCRGWERYIGYLFFK